MFVAVPHPCCQNIKQQICLPGPPTIRARTIGFTDNLLWRGQCDGDVGFNCFHIWLRAQELHQIVLPFFTPVEPRTRWIIRRRFVFTDNGKLLITNEPKNRS